MVINLFVLDYLQSTQTAFNDHNMDASIMDDEFLPNIDDDEEIGEDVNGLNDLFSDWDDQMIQPSSPDRRSRPGSPGMDEIMVQRNSPGLPSSNGGQKAQQDNEEVGGG